MYYWNSGYQGLNYDTSPQHIKRHISTHKPLENRDDGNSISIDLNQIISNLQPNEITVILDLLKGNNLEMEDLSQYRRELQDCIHLLLRCEPSKRWSLYERIHNQFLSRPDCITQIKKFLFMFLDSELHSSSYTPKYIPHKTYGNELHASRVLQKHQQSSYSQNPIRNTIQLPIDSRWYKLQSDRTTNSSLSTRSTDSMRSDSAVPETLTEPQYKNIQQLRSVAPLRTKPYHPYDATLPIYSRSCHLIPQNKQNQTFPSVSRDAVSYPPNQSMSHRYFENYGSSIPIDIELLESWGSLESIGLTGISLIDQNNNVIPVKTFWFSCRCTCSPTGLLNNCDVLFDFRNCHEFYPLIHIEMPTSSTLKEIKLFNYNKETEKGVKFVKIYINQSLLGSNKIYIRKAPGVDCFDYSQQISISHPKTVFNLLPKPQASLQRFVNLEQDYCCPVHPCGSILKFQFHSNWGNVDYIGLNQILLYNPEGVVLTVNQNSVISYPKKDEHDKNNLFHAYNVFSGGQGWISSIYRKTDILNCIYIEFQIPIVIGCIKICNYADLPTCGVKAMTILLDNNIIYSGDLRKNNRSSPHAAQSILFTNNPILQEKEKGNIYHAPAEKLVLVDNKNILSLSSPELKQQFNSSYHFN